MQTKEIKELKNQASLLGKYLRALPALKGVELTHSQLLEAMAAMHNAPDWNALQAREPEKAVKPASAMTAEELMEAAVEKGWRFGEMVNFFAARQTAQEQAYAAYARENLVSEGDLEFDDPGCIVSLSEDNGAYVMGWKWVYESDVPALKRVVSKENPPESLAEIEDAVVYLLNAYAGGQKVAADDVNFRGNDLVVTDEAGQTLLVIPVQNWDEAAVSAYKLQPEDAEDAENQCIDDDSLLVRVKYQAWELRIEVQL